MALLALLLPAGRPTFGADELADAEPSGWRSLFDGKSLGHWSVSRFGGEGAVSVQDGELHVEIGAPMSGIFWDGEPLPKIDYEIELEAQRTGGIDFFLGLTFPVKEDYCSLILGGWGGSLTGLSSLNGADASENETSQFITYEQGRWYKVRLRVTDQKIEAWLDEKQIIDVELEDQGISTRIEMELCKPLGLATYLTHGAYRNLRCRSLNSPETQTVP